MFLKVDTRNYLMLSRHLQVGGEIFEMWHNGWPKMVQNPGPIFLYL